MVGEATTQPFYNEYPVTEFYNVKRCVIFILYLFKQTTKLVKNVNFLERIQDSKFRQLPKLG